MATPHSLSEVRLADVARYRRLEEELADASPDPGLLRIFTRKLEERRDANRAGLGLKGFQETGLPPDADLRNAFDQLHDYAAMAASSVTTSTTPFARRGFSWPSPGKAPGRPPPAA